MKAFSALVLLLLIASVSWAQTSKSLEATDFKTSSNCRNCHEQIYDQWTTSMHSKAFRDPIYQVLLRRVDEDRQGKLTRFCVSCQAPLAHLRSKARKHKAPGDHLGTVSISTLRATFPGYQRRSYWSGSCLTSQIGRSACSARHADG